MLRLESDSAATRHNELANLILKTRRYRSVTLFALFVLVISTAVLYCTLVAPALMRDNLMNPAYLKFMTSEAFQRIVQPHFDVLQAHSADPRRHPRPQANLMAIDPSQLGLMVNVEYALEPQQDPSADGIQRYRYDTRVRVQPALDVMAGFVGLEIILIGFLVWALKVGRDPIQREYEAAVLRGYFFPAETETADTPAAHGALLRLLARFHVYANELQAKPRVAHHAWMIKDEYDVQQALCALLRTHFDNVKPEETNPSLAGSSTRVDFLLVNERTGVEAKMMRDSLTEPELGKQLLLDLAQFPSHSKCESLIFLIYDPTHRLRNPAGIREDVMNAARGFPVEVLFSPPR